jgi:hypothetical protein
MRIIYFLKELNIQVVHKSYIENFGNKFEYINYKQS